VGGALNADPTKDGVSPSIATVGGVPYVAWREGTGLPGLVRVARWSGSGWTAVGGVLNVDPTRNAFLPQIIAVHRVPRQRWLLPSRGSAVANRQAFPVGLRSPWQLTVSRGGADGVRPSGAEWSACGRAPARAARRAS
jgi:hypothetical protein